MVAVCFLVGFIVLVFIKSAEIRIDAVKIQDINLIPICTNTYDKCVFVSNVRNNFLFYDIP